MFTNWDKTSKAYVLPILCQILYEINRNETPPKLNLEAVDTQNLCLMNAKIYFCN